MASPDDKTKPAPQDDAGRTQRFEPVLSREEIEELEAAEHTARRDIDEILPAQPPGKSAAAGAGAAPPAREATARFEAPAPPGGREATTRFDHDEIAPQAPAAPGKEKGPAPGGMSPTVQRPGIEQHPAPEARQPARPAPPRPAAPSGKSVTDEHTKPLPASAFKPSGKAAPEGDSGVQLADTNPELILPRPAGPLGDQTTAQRPMIEGLEKPFSLEPDDVESPEAAALEQSMRRGMPRAALALIGLAAGLGVCALAYFRPHPLPFAVAAPTIEKLAAPPTIDGAEPPHRWVVADGLFFGIDTFSNPWTYDPRNGQTARAAKYIPPSLADTGKLAVVGRPPLDSHTRLAWIVAGSADGSADLVCRDYDFASAKGAANPDAASSAGRALAPLDVTIPLPAGEYPFAPTVADDPNPKIGLRLITVDSKGAIAAWAPLAAVPKKAAWQQPSGSAPLHAPLAWLDLGAQKPAEWILTMTAERIEAFDAATGQSAGKLDWGMTAGRPLAVAAVRAAGRRAAWVASDGKRAVVVALAENGQPQKISEFACGEDLGSEHAPARLVTFPSGAHPESDEIVIGAPEAGKLAWLTAAGATAALVDRSTTGTLAAMDLSGDGFYDLAALSDGGQLWLASGAAHHEAESKAAGAAAAGSPVRWRVSGDALIAEYLSAQGAPMRVSLKLPPAAAAHAKELAADWKARHPEWN